MQDWKKFLYRIANRSEHSFDALIIRFREHMGMKTNVHIHTYTSFGTDKNLLVKGRILHHRKIESSEHDSIWDNLADMYRRFSSHEIKGAVILVSYREHSVQIISDEDGYFETFIPFSHENENRELWHYPEVELLECPYPFQKPLKTTCKVMVPPVSAAFGVISDIDDTVLPSHAEEIVKMMYTTFTSNAYSRIPFKGVPEFYTALQNGRTGNNSNPIFYVSSSPWNLFDFISDFLTINKIPEGPVMLKDYGFTHNKFFTEGHHGHKEKVIDTILKTYPFLPFILIGDSGQKDPEIYSGIIKEHPHRIIAVFIRDVSIDERCAEIKHIFDDKQGHNVPMILSENTQAAYDHCLTMGLVN